MYDLRFIFDECGFGDVPDYIDRSRLFNVSLDLTSGYLKLYVLDASERFVHKVTPDGITRQYSAAGRTRASRRRLPSTPCRSSKCR